jgi:hypothetical protein
VVPITGPISLNRRQSGSITLSLGKAVKLSDPQVDDIVDRALAEDLGWGDITTEALIPSDQRGSASLVAKEKGVLAGTDLAKTVFHRVDPELKVDISLPPAAEWNCIRDKPLCGSRYGTAGAHRGY